MADLKGGGSAQGRGRGSSIAGVCSVHKGHLMLWQGNAVRHVEDCFIPKTKHDLPTSVALFQDSSDKRTI